MSRPQWTFETFIEYLKNAGLNSAAHTLAGWRNKTGTVQGWDKYILTLGISLP